MVIPLFNQGNNDYVIDVLTQQLHLLTWDEAFACLNDEQLSKSLRAKYCDLIVGELMERNSVSHPHSSSSHLNFAELFLSNDESNAVADSLQLSFLFDDVGRDALPFTVRTFTSLASAIDGYLNSMVAGAPVGHF